MNVRPARPNEVDAVLPTYEWLFEPPGSRPHAWDPGRAREALADAIGAEGRTVLVAEDDGRLIGLCTAYIDLESVRFGRRCWVEDLAVDPDRRSEGVGAALLAEAREWARELGATHLELDSADNRTDAHRFYEREGPSGRSFCYSWEL
jgi:GNAT superfamily N-acetyltransferase